MTTYPRDITSPWVEYKQTYKHRRHHRGKRMRMVETPSRPSSYGVFDIPSKGLPTFLSTFVCEIHEGMMASEVDIEQLELDRFSMSSTSRNSLSSLLHSTHHRISRLYNTAEMMYSSDSSCGSLYQPKSYHTCKASE
ncbi:hypothetical protein BV22DRAFT_925384 [Leucogyrophana mollusca]|uniref:Uncharacterized protein n=1 Tax=Leucogyrophana mollusca TaxID=85980 RepID=A0ACB8AX77_9AGAM|nr:hypothetical protein BV22DRAFT_925384 [Leucogyrophana mollusca]